MPYFLERYGNKAIVVNTKTGKHHSLEPIPLKNAKAQMRLLSSLPENKMKQEKKE
jgi:bifunctional DNA-binding transcriptional regulator/antitoxin component of YhaV-PrlF toxin-antitoxin module